MKTRKLDKSQIGKKLKKIRLEKKLSVKELSKIIGVKSNNTIYNWESGINIPSLVNIICICNFYKLSTRIFMVFKKD